MKGSKMKGGPGSRGGRVVGMTKGGNAIYAKNVHKPDRLALAKGHLERAESLKKSGHEKTAAFHNAMAAHHSALWQHHEKSDKTLAKQHYDKLLEHEKEANRASKNFSLTGHFRALGR